MGTRLPFVLYRDTYREANSTKIKIVKRLKQVLRLQVGQTLWRSAIDDRWHGKVVLNKDGEWALSPESC